MSGNFKKIVSISCKEATMLVSKREENAVTNTERLKLFIHLLICRFCRIFVRQTKLFSSHTEHLHQDKHLSYAAKAKMEELIRGEHK